MPSFRLLTQHSLHEREASFAKLFLENPQPMWVFDLEDFYFLEVNAAAIEHYGYTRDEFLEMRVTEIRPADDVRAFLDEVAGRCQLTGGQIRNAVLHASLLALEDGGVIDAGHIELAVHREYRKTGSVCPLRATAVLGG